MEEKQEGCRHEEEEMWETGTAWTAGAQVMTEARDKRIQNPSDPPNRIRRQL